MLFSSNWLLGNGLASGAGEGAEGGNEEGGRRQWMEKALPHPSSAQTRISPKRNRASTTIRFSTPRLSEESAVGGEGFKHDISGALELIIKGEPVVQTLERALVQEAKQPWHGPLGRGPTLAGAVCYVRLAWNMIFHTQRKHTV